MVARRKIKKEEGDFFSEEFNRAAKKIADFIPSHNQNKVESPDDKVEKQSYSDPLRLQNNHNKVENNLITPHSDKDQSPDQVIKNNLIKIDRQPYSSQIRLKNNLIDSKNNLISEEKNTTSPSQETYVHETEGISALILNERMLDAHLQKLHHPELTPTVRRIIIELYKLGERRQSLSLSVNFVQFVQSVGISKSTARVASNLLKAIDGCFDAFYPVKRSGTVVLLQGLFFGDAPEGLINNIKSILPFDLDPSEILGLCIIHAGVAPDDISRKLIKTVFQEQSRLIKEGQSIRDACLYCTSVVVYALSRGTEIRRPSAYLNAIFANGTNAAQDNITAKELEKTAYIYDLTVKLIQNIDEIGVSDLAYLGSAWGYMGKKDRYRLSDFIIDRVLNFMCYLHKELNLIKKADRRELSRLMAATTSLYNKKKPL